jgi:hypothetical protein
LTPEEICGKRSSGLQCKESPFFPCFRQGHVSVNSLLYTHARFTAVFFYVDFDFKPLSELESESEISPPALRFKPQDAMTEENESETSLRMRVLTFPSSSRRNKLSSRLFTVLKENRISFFFYLQ